MSEPAPTKLADARTRLTIWIDRTTEALDRTRGGRYILELARGSLTVLHHLFQERIFERASALSFGTIVSFVPLLALSVAIAGSIGHGWLRSRIQELVTIFLAPAFRKGSLDYLEALIDRASTGAVGSVSGLALAYSVITLLRQVDDIINGIWGVRESRKLALRLSIYVLLTVASPILLGLSVGATAILRAEILHIDLPFARPILAIGPVVVTVLGLDLLYQVVPNVQVRKRAAFAGALVAGVAWEIAKHGYAFYTDHFMRYGAVYGSLAAIPLLLLWIYLSWIILLFGARLAYSVQNAGSWGADVLPTADGTRVRLAARTMLAVAVSHLSGRTPSVHTVARQTGISTAVVGEGVRLLFHAGLLRQDDNGGLFPCRPLEEIHLTDIAHAAHRWSSDLPVLGDDAASKALREVFDRSELAASSALAPIDLRSLALPFAQAVPAK
jgi:membrane protein